MSIIDRFNKLIGREAEPISDREKWRRSMVRSGNLDWEGLPIDRNAGAPITARPDQRGYRERVADFLDRANIRLEQRNTHIPTLAPNQFDKEAAITEQAHDRRFDRRQDRDVKSVNEFLRDGAAAPPKGSDQ